MGMCIGDGDRHGHGRVCMGMSMGMPRRHTFGSAWRHVRKHMHMRMRECQVMRRLHLAVPSEGIRISTAEAEANRQALYNENVEWMKVRPLGRTCACRCAHAHGHAVARALAHACVCACMCVRMHVCAHAFVCACICVRMHVCAHARAQVLEEDESLRQPTRYWFDGLGVGYAHAHARLTCSETHARRCAHTHMPCKCATRQAEQPAASRRCDDGGAARGDR